MHHPKAYVVLRYVKEERKRRRRGLVTNRSDM
jgi:hypothetical protein